MPDNIPTQQDIIALGYTDTTVHAVLAIYQHTEGMSFEEALHLMVKQLVSDKEQMLATFTGHMMRCTYHAQ